MVPNSAARMRAFSLKILCEFETQEVELASVELREASTRNVRFRAVKLSAYTETEALFVVEPVLLAVSLYVMIVESLPVP